MCLSRLSISCQGNNCFRYSNSSKCCLYKNVLLNILYVMSCKQMLEGNYKKQDLSRTMIHPSTSLKSGLTMWSVCFVPEIMNHFSSLCFGWCLSEDESCTFTRTRILINDKEALFSPTDKNAHNRKLSHEHWEKCNFFKYLVGVTDIFSVI